jgi:predicted ATPase/signal transduction histidine kinase
VGNCTTRSILRIEQIRTISLPMPLDVFTEPRPRRVGRKDRVDSGGVARATDVVDAKAAPWFGSAEVDDDGNRPAHEVIEASDWASSRVNFLRPARLEPAHNAGASVDGDGGRQTAMAEAAGPSGAQADPGNPGRGGEPTTRERLGGSSLAGDGSHDLAADTYHARPGPLLDDFGGVPLRRQLGAPTEIGHFLRLALAISEELADLHAGRVVHRDLRPDNILVNPLTGQVRIVAGAPSAPGSTGAAETVRLLPGSLPYVSPEQTGHGSRPVDARSDLYSLGISCFEMLTGRLPFHATDPVDWVHCHVASRPPMPSSLVPGIPEPIGMIVAKLLNKEPDDRYQSARGLRHDLQRCYVDWATKGRIEAFRLGERDASDQFAIPHRLYGRDPERAALQAAFERVRATGTAELALVAGRAGIGKSALVHDLQRSLVAQRGAFAEGKFDQFKRDIPYFTLVQACTDLVLAILAEHDSRIADWKTRLQTALGPNGQLIVDVIPQLELVIGRQIPVPALPPAESQNRFRFAFRRFLHVFARAPHPLVLFLDDLQWADEASLALLTDLVTQSQTCHLLVVGAYRDNEVDPSHPLALTLQRVHKAGGRVAEVKLGPLPVVQLGALVADVLHRPPAEVQPLAQLIEAKTGGNPFFTIQFLTALHDEGLIAFDAEAERWRWDIARIEEQRFTDNVVELMLGKLARLSPVSQAACKLLACLGTRAEIATVRLVLDRSAGDNAYQALFEAVDAGLLMRTGETVRFVHDRVQEAAYSQIPAADQAEVHLRIGRLLVAALPGDAIEEAVFDVVNHLNRGWDLITSADEQALLCRLNRLAGERAKAAIAYASAQGYFTRATALLAIDAWTAHYEETFALHLSLAECEYLAGDFVAADQRFTPLIERARSLQDRMRVTRLQIRLYQTTGRFADALTLGLEAFRSLGVTCPDDDQAMQTEFAHQVAEVAKNLGDRRIADLVDAPPATDPEACAAIGLLVDHLAAALNSGSKTLPLTVLKVLNLCLRHGHTEEACFTYSAAAMVIVATPGDVASAYEFSSLALRLNDKYDDPKLRGKVLVVHLACIYFWRESFSAHPPLVERALAACLQVGDFLWVGNVGGQAMWHTIEKGASLDEILLASQRFAEIFRQTHNDLVCFLLSQFDHFAANLKGTTFDSRTFSDSSFDENACLELFRRAGAVAGLFVHHLLKEMVHFIWGHAAAARESAALATEYQSASPGTALAVTHLFFHTLILAASHDEAPAEQRDGIRQALADKVAILRDWARECPANFHNRHALAAAELARIEGRPLQAMQLYDRAIRSATEQGFTHLQAIANEVAARFYQAQGLPTIADQHLRQACTAYAAWGAEGKVRQLEAQHPQLLQPRSARTAAQTMAAADMDLLSVIKASHVISGEIDLGELLQKLVRVVVAHAGAEKGYVLLRRAPPPGETPVDDLTDLSIEAEARSDDTGDVVVQMQQTAPGAMSVLLPVAIVNYVARTKTPVLLDDAGQASRFAGDEYLLRSRTKSVLCLPIVRQGDLVGLFYLENAQMAAAFRPDQVQLLELLASQAAISIENARLLRQEREARSLAEEAQRRSTILAEASGMFVEAADDDAKFTHLASLLVPALSPWCVIHLVREGEFQVVAVAHADPMQHESLRESALAARPRWAAGDPVTQLMSGGGANERARSFRFDVGLAVPILVRARTLGTISLGPLRAPPHDQADRALVVEIARRAALALDNAQREEFLSIASHELNNPLGSLLVALQELGEPAVVADGVRAEKYRRIAQRLGKRLGRLIRELHDLARIERGKLLLEAQRVDLRAMVEEVVEGQRADLERAGCAVSLHAPAAVVGQWDPSRVEQVVLNLLSNASKFGAGKPIEIEVTQPGDWARVAVTDHGRGIVPVEQARLFERHEHGASQGSGGHSGLGLGLYICRRIVDAHHGTIRVQSQPGLGATFVVELPCAPPSR